MVKVHIMGLFSILEATCLMTHADYASNTVLMRILHQGLFSISQPRHGIVCFKLADIGEGALHPCVDNNRALGLGIIRHFAAAVAAILMQRLSALANHYFPGIASVELTKWYKKEGDTVEEVREAT